MAYRVKTLFKDDTVTGPYADIIALPAPRCGDTLSVNRYGQDTPVRVTAVWTPAAALLGGAPGVVIMVEAREI